MLAFISDTGIVVAVIAFVALFGASQLPKLARNIGEAGKEFRKAHAELETPRSVTAISTPVLAGASEDRIMLTRPDLDGLPANRSAHADRA